MVGRLKNTIITLNVTDFNIVLRKKPLLILCILLVSLVAYDIFIGKKSAPVTHTAPSSFCKTGYEGITLPPVGIFICPEYKTHAQLNRHERIHWSQYQRMGTLTFYGNYIAGWVLSGFNYKGNWMEKEAYENDQGKAL